MKLLLDTHIWIWLYSRPEKVSRTVRRQVESPKNELFVSPISVWEARHLEIAGRLRLRVPFAVWLDRVTASAAIQEAPFNFAVAAEASGISLPQSDVGDVFLAATASVHKMTLVTEDQQLIDCPWLSTLANE